MLEQREKQKEEQKTGKQGREAREAKEGVKKLKLRSCRSKSIKFRPKCPVALATKDGVIRFLLVKRKIVTLQQNNGSSAVNAKSGGMINISQL
ncbi:hypothetical protein TNCV_972701 [Trichonephila clavipes]|nr:hypothetical protein TNCV_972701 [Trichonephila clavipes]